jgi:hypothetical protein
MQLIYSGWDSHSDTISSLTYYPHVSRIQSTVDEALIRRTMTHVVGHLSRLHHLYAWHGSCPALPALAGPPEGFYADVGEWAKRLN